MPICARQISILGTLIYYCLRRFQATSSLSHHPISNWRNKAPGDPQLEYGQTTDSSLGGATPLCKNQDLGYRLECRVLPSGTVISLRVSVPVVGPVLSGVAALVPPR